MDFETLCDLLSEYIDHELNPQELKELEDFVCKDEECRALINSMLETVELCHMLEAIEVPLDIHVRFRRTIRVEIKKYF